MGPDWCSCRMYRSWPEVRDGYAKNILAGYGNNLFFLALATLFHWLILLMPWAWLTLGLIWSVDGAVSAWPAPADRAGSIDPRPDRRRHPPAGG